MSTAKQILHEITDPNNTLPNVDLEFQSHGYDADTYAAMAIDDKIGHIKLGQVDKGEPFVVQSSYVDERLRGRGYGLAMYLGAAALAYDQGYQLTSDILVSRDAAAIWSRLQDHGVARIWEPFRWTAGNDYSSRGRAKFVQFEHLESIRPQSKVDDLASIWRDI